MLRGKRTMERIDKVYLQRNKVMMVFCWLLFSFIGFVLIANASLPIVGIALAIFSICILVTFSVVKRVMIRKIPYILLVFLMVISGVMSIISPTTYFASSILWLALLMLYPNYRLTLIYGVVVVALLLKIDITAGQSISEMLTNRLTDVIIYALFLLVSILNERLFLEAEKRTTEATEVGSRIETIIGSIRDAATTLTGYSEGLRKSANDIGKLSNEMTQAFSEVARGVEVQASRVASISTNISSNGEQIERVAGSAAIMKSLSVHTANITKRGREQVEELHTQMLKVDTDMENTVASMKVLNQQSEQIAGMLSTIKGIAEQTHLLSLNSAIEAARAGEAGRGFAVVSNEVRKLAKSSQDATEEIDSILTDIQMTCRSLTQQLERNKYSIDQSQLTVVDSRQLLKQIAENTNEVVTQATDVNENTERIQHASELIVYEVSDISSITQQSTASVEQILASMEEQRQKVEQIVGSFQELDDLIKNLSVMASRE